jgi:hypothetical protein
MSIGQYSMAESSTDQSLPVELVSFTVYQDGFMVNLNWEIASEMDNLGFIIERKSSLDLSYKEIASYQYNPELVGQGNSTQLQEYHFRDFVENEGSYLYRLYQTDSNGSRNLIGNKKIDIVLSNIDKFSLIGIYPNPFNSVTQIEVFLPVSFRPEITIYNITGQKVDDISTGVLEKGIQKVKWDASSLPAGFYFLNIRYENEQISRKVLYLK